MVGWFLQGSLNATYVFGDHFQCERMVTCRDFHFVIVHCSGFLVLFPDPLVKGICNGYTWIRKLSRFF